MSTDQATHQRTAAIVGVLYIIGTVAGILCRVSSGSILEGPDYLAQIAANENQIITGALFVLTMGLALAAIPAVVFPVLRKQHEGLAVGYVIFRGALETFAYIAMTASWLVLVVLSREFVGAGAPAVSSFQPLGAVVLGAHDAFRSIVGIVFMVHFVGWLATFFQFFLFPGFQAVTYVTYPLGFVSEFGLSLWLLLKGVSEPTPVAAPMVRATS